MALFDLTTPSAVNAWMGAPTSDSTPQIVSLITSCSRAILSAIDRPRLLPQTYTELYDTDPSTKRVTLRNFPVLSVASVQIGPTVLAPVSPLTGQPIFFPPALGYGMGYGYALEADRWSGAPPGEPQDVIFYGVIPYRRDEGMQVVYSAGYQTIDSVTLPGSPYQVVAQGPYGAWATDQGVTYTATGTALTAVSGTPAAGQYSVNNGAYTFSATDTGQAVSIAYGFTPYDLAQACIEFVAQRLTAAQRIGVKSKSLASQETVTFDTSNMPQAVSDLIRPYRRISFL